VCHGTVLELALVDLGSISMVLVHTFSTLAFISIATIVVTVVVITLATTVAAHTRIGVLVQDLPDARALDLLAVLTIESPLTSTESTVSLIRAATAALAHATSPPSTGTTITLSITWLISARHLLTLRHIAKGKETQKRVETLDVDLLLLVRLTLHINFHPLDLADFHLVVHGSGQIIDTLLECNVNLGDLVDPFVMLLDGFTIVILDPGLCVQTHAVLHLCITSQLDLCHPLEVSLMLQSTLLLLNVHHDHYKSLLLLVVSVIF